MTHVSSGNGTGETTLETKRNDTRNTSGNKRRKGSPDL